MNRIRTHDLLPARALRATSLAVLLALSACTSVHTAGHPEFAVSSGQTYAWGVATLARLESLVQAQDGFDLSQLQAQVDRQLERVGLARAHRALADYLLDVKLVIEQKTKFNDPYFTMVVAEQFEEGHLQLALRARDDQQRYWRGEALRQLRVTGRSTGGLQLEFHPTDRVRDWQLESLLASILAELPRAD